MQHVLNIDEYVVASSPDEIVCYGLGSCVGVFLYDSINKTGAGLHLSNSKLNVLKKENDLMEKTWQQFRARRIPSDALSAKVVGGSRIMKFSNFNIGISNVEHVLKFLEERDIPVVASDVNGNISRTARLHLTTGDLVIRNSNLSIYTI